MDLVSVVIPTFKRKQELEKALQSVADQTYKNIEILIVDDNTDQEFSDYVKKLINDFKENTEIIYIKNKKNLGGARSRNAGLNQAKGKYIAFLDDDDAYYPSKIEKQVQCFKNSKLKRLAVVYCFSVSLDKDENVIQTYTNDVRGDFLYDSMKNTVAATTQWLCLKEALLNIRGFRNVPSKQDTTLLMDLALAGYQIDYVPEVLSKYYELDIERISGGGLKNLKGELLLRKHMREHYDRLKPEQIKKVEYNITLRIYYLQIRLGLYGDAWNSLKTLIRTNIRTRQTALLAIKHPLRVVMRKK